MEESNSLVCPFLDESPSYAHGVELGMLSRDMQRKKRIRAYVTIANQEQVTLLANRSGWKINKMQPWADAPDQWFWLDMAKK